MGSIRGPCSPIEGRTESEASLPGPPIDFQAEFIDLNMPIDNSLSTLTPTLRFRWKKPKINPQNIAKYRLYYQHLHFGPINNNNNFEPLKSEDSEFLNEYADERTTTAVEKYLDIEMPTGSDNHHSHQNDAYNEFLLEDLLKYSTYKFRLVAMDNASLLEESLEEKRMEEGSVGLEEEDDEEHSIFARGLNSAEIIVETPSDVPDGPPDNLQVETLNTTAILVYWDPPALEKRNGMIVGYKVTVKENDKQVWHSNEDSEPRRKVINGLLPKHKYSVRVTARTINGTGPASEWTIAETFAHEMDGTLTKLLSV